MRIENFAGRSPELTLEHWFVGRTDGWGVMQDRFGTLQRQFRVTAEGTWDAATGTLLLVEIYRFDDGQVDRLEWRIRPLGNGRYAGDEPRLIGEAEGQQAGNAFHWTYTRRVPGDGKERRLDFDDWFWLQDERVLISRASAGRFGIEFATLSLFYRKP